jgi:hypothetical protein
MKPFTQYLTEAEKSYFFKISVAGELAEDFEDTLETMLQKYQLKNLSKGKRTPIQERPLDFPQLQNMEVTHFEVEVAYPTTTQVLQQYVEDCGCLQPGYVRVVDPHAQEIADGDQAGEARTEDDGPYEALLNSEYVDPVKSDTAQQNVGGTKVMDLLAELEKARKERENDPMEGAPRGDSQDITTEENATSPIGS